MAAFDKLIPMTKFHQLALINRWIIIAMIIVAVIGLIPLSLNHKSVGSFHFCIAPCPKFVYKHSWKKESDYCYVPMTYSCTFIQHGTTLQILFFRIVIEEGQETHAR